MAREKLTPAQWGEIKTQWIATSKSCREIASDFGVAESYIRKTAGKEAWGPRNAPERKRAIVAARMSGAQIGAQCAPRTESEGLIQSAAEDDIEDMSLAARVGRRILQRCEWLLDLVKIDKDDKPTEDPALDDPKELKATAEAARSAMEMIRRARNLDEPAPPPKEESSLDRLASTLAQARRDRL